MDRIEDLSRLFERFPGIGPRQARRFVYHLLAQSQSERSALGNLISTIAADIRQCKECMRYANGKGPACTICTDQARDASLLMLVEKDQDLQAMERSSAYRGRYFVLGGTLTLSGKGAIRERELVAAVKKRDDLKEVVIAVSATAEGEMTADRIRELLLPFRDRIKVSLLGRGLSTGSELEYADKETLSGALAHRTEA